MKTFKVLFLTSVFIVLSLTTGLAQTEGKLSAEISNATRNGDAADLASHFNAKIEMVLPDKSGVFSKEQAQFLIKDFFDKHPPTSFQIIHQGERENATFAIGRYNYNRGQYRLVFLTKNNGNQTLIHQLRVEKQDE
jgi:archaellum component FlaG (FlaF/FlaG flagellin family)